MAYRWWELLVEAKLILIEELAGVRVDRGDEFAVAHKVADRQIDGDDLVRPDLHGEQGLLIFLAGGHILLPSFSPYKGCGYRYVGGATKCTQGTMCETNWRHRDKGMQPML